MNWPEEKEVLAKTLDLVKEFESFQPKPYICPAGYPTIGYGSRTYPNGKKVSLSDTAIKKQDAELYAGFSLLAKLNELKRSGSITRNPTVGQLAAILDLAYNVGVGIHDGVMGDLADSTLLSKFNKGDIRGAAAQFSSWNKAFDPSSKRMVAMSGLTRRREAEAKLFLGDTTK